MLRTPIILTRAISDSTLKENIPASSQWDNIKDIEVVN